MVVVIVRGGGLGAAAIPYVLCNSWLALYLLQQEEGWLTVRRYSGIHSIIEKQTFWLERRAGQQIIPTFIPWKNMIPASLPDSYNK